MVFQSSFPGKTLHPDAVITLKFGRQSMEGVLIAPDALPNDMRLPVGAIKLKQVVSTMIELVNIMDSSSMGFHPGSQEESLNFLDNKLAKARKLLAKPTLTYDSENKGFDKIPRKVVDTATQAKLDKAKHESAKSKSKKRIRRTLRRTDSNTSQGSHHSATSSLDFGCDMDIVDFKLTSEDEQGAAPQADQAAGGKGPKTPKAKPKAKDNTQGAAPKAPKTVSNRKRVVHQPGAAGPSKAAKTQDGLDARQRQLKRRTLTKIAKDRVNVDEKVKIFETGEEA